MRRASLITRGKDRAAIDANNEEELRAREREKESGRKGRSTSSERDKRGKSCHVSFVRRFNELQAACERRTGTDVLEWMHLDRVHSGAAARCGRVYESAIPT